MVVSGPSKPNVREMEIKCDIEGLIKALESEDVYIKRNAVQALGKMRSEKAINALNNALNDNDGLVKIHAKNALDIISKINHESSKNNKFNFSNTDLIAFEEKNDIKSLVNAFYSDDTNVSWNAARILGRMKSEDSVNPLVRTLNDEDANVRLKAATALGWIQDKKAIKPLENLLGDNDKRVIDNAKKAIKRIKNDEFLSVPLVNLSKENSDINHLSKNKETSYESTKLNINDLYEKNDVEGLIKALKHVDSDVRLQAVEALGNIGDERAIGPLNQYWRARGSYSAQSAINKIKNKKISEENSSNSNLKSNSKGWWSRQNKNNKIGIGFLSCILGIVVLVGIFGTLTSTSNLESNYTVSPQDIEASQNLQEKFKNSTIFTSSLDNYVNQQYTNLSMWSDGTVKHFDYNYYIINATPDLSECYLTLTVYWTTDRGYEGDDNWNLTGKLYHNYNKTTHNFSDPYYNFLGNSTTETTHYPISRS